MGKAFVLMLVQQVIPMESPAMEPVHVAALALIDCFKSTNSFDKVSCHVSVSSLVGYAGGSWFVRLIGFLD